jgi:8-oxo-dGTP pyrophosphatase MutT (NUDIX family)
MDPSKVVTAGAFVLVKGRIPFVVGPTSDRMAVAVIRLGGHREDGETPWECARRECYEEAQLNISPIRPLVSFRVQSHQANEWVITPVEDVRGFDPVVPFTISDRNWMYLATSENVPTPGDVHGLLLLDRMSILRLSTKRLTLGELVALGVTMELRPDVAVDLSLTVRPFPQLVWLAKILRTWPEVLGSDLLE